MNFFKSVEQTPAKPYLEVVLREKSLLMVSATVGGLKAPKHLLFGIIAAIFCDAVAKGKISSQHAPLAASCVTVMEEVIKSPMAPVDVAALLAMMVFEGFGEIAATYIGFQLGFAGLQYAR